MENDNCGSYKPFSLGLQGLDGRDGLPGEPGLDGMPGKINVSECNSNPSWQFLLAANFLRNFKGKYFSLCLWHIVVHVRAL